MKRSSQAGASGIVVLVVLAALAAAGVALYGYANSVRSQALASELDLGKTLKIEISERATYQTSITEQLGLATAKTAAIKDIIGAALEGRYGDNPKEGNLLFKAVAEAYPGTEGTAIYDKVLTGVQAGREAIRNKQNLRVEKAASYKFWLGDGFIRSRILAAAGYPSSDLQFRTGDREYKGAEALAKMAEPISTADVNKTFDTGLEQPLNTGGAKPEQK